jgi:hypothetical protein
MLTDQNGRDMNYCGGTQDLCSNTESSLEKQMLFLTGVSPFYQDHKEICDSVEICSLKNCSLNRSASQPVLSHSAIIRKDLAFPWTLFVA